MMRKTALIFLASLVVTTAQSLRREKTSSIERELQAIDLSSVEDQLRDLYDDIYNFPIDLFTTLFGDASAYEVPPYHMVAVSELPGVYPGYNENGDEFNLTVEEVVITSTDLFNAILSDEDIDENTTTWINDNNYMAFGVKGYINGTVGSSCKVIAFLGKTQNQTEYFLTVQGRDETATPSRRVTVQSRELGGCDNALQKAKDAFHCPPPGTIVVNQACVDAAFAAYNLAVDVANGKYDAAIDAAQIAYEVAMAALTAWRIRKIAIALAKCAAMALIPFVGTGLAVRCAAVETAKIIAIEIAKRAAIAAAKAAAIALADKILALALDAACQALLAALNACFDCVQPSPVPSPTVPSPTTIEEPTYEYPSPSNSEGPHYEHPSPSNSGSPHYY